MADMEKQANPPPYPQAQYPPQPSQPYPPQHQYPTAPVGTQPPPAPGPYAPAPGENESQIHHHMFDLYNFVVRQCQVRHDRQCLPYVLVRVRQCHTPNFGGPSFSAPPSTARTELKGIMVKLKENEN